MYHIYHISFIIYHISIINYMFLVKAMLENATSIIRFLANVMFYYTKSECFLKM